MPGILPWKPARGHNSVVTLEKIPTGACIPRILWETHLSNTQTAAVQVLGVLEQSSSTERKAQKLTLLPMANARQRGQNQVSKAQVMCFFCWAAFSIVQEQSGKDGVPWSQRWNEPGEGLHGVSQGSTIQGTVEGTNANTWSYGSETHPGAVQSLGSW